MKKQIKKLGYHLIELKKAYSKNLINDEAYNLTYEYYSRKLRCYEEKIDKLKLLSRSYSGVLYNQQIDTEIELKNLRQGSKKSGYDKTIYINMKKKIKGRIANLIQKQDFFKKIYNDS